MRGQPCPRRLSALCAAALLLLSAVPVAAADSASSPAESKNIYKNDYTVWSKPMTSYLYEDGGELVRVEYINGSVIVETYGGSFALQASKIIEAELPIWGGFYAGEAYNFLFFGQSNTSESNAAEVIRVVKYGKDWKRIGQASLMGANTSVPFDGGSLRCDEYGGMLYVRTAHEMYKSPDGYNHQANLTFSVRQSDMEITDAFYGVMNPSVGYVSHSFNQFILVDGEQNLITLDHGDAYPRAVVLMKYAQKAGGDTFTGRTTNVSLCTFPGAVGANGTGASAGGLAETTNGYVAAYNQDTSNNNQFRGVYLAYTPKDSFQSGSVQIRTLDAGTSASSTTPLLVPTGMDGGYVLWNVKDAAGYGFAASEALRYATYGANGSVSAVSRAAGAPLSDCQPIPYGDGIVWYTAENSAPVFYTLDADGVESHPTAAEPETPPEPEEPTPTPANPTTPTTPTTPEEPAAPTEPQRPYFNDVPTSHWGYESVQYVTAKGLFKGTSNTTFSPAVTMDRAMLATVLYRYAGSPAVFGSAGYQDVPADAYYADAVVWAWQNEIFASWVQDGGRQLNPTEEVARSEFAVMLYNFSRYMGDSYLDEGALYEHPYTDMGTSQFGARAAEIRTAMLCWAWPQGLLNGTSATAMSPSDSITRAQVAALLHRYDEKVMPRLGGDGGGQAEKDCYREDYTNGDYLQIELIEGKTARFSGRMTLDGGPYNYVVLRVCGGQAEAPFASGVPFSITAQVDVDLLAELYFEQGVEKTIVSAMICQNYAPGDAAIVGFSFQERMLALRPDVEGGVVCGCVLGSS